MSETSPILQKYDKKPGTFDFNLLTKYEFFDKFLLFDVF